jgi:hypothetical protein
MRDVVSEACGEPDADYEKLGELRECFKTSVA